MKNLKRIAGGAMFAGALGLGALGFGAGAATANPHHDICWLPLDQPPGHIGQDCGVPPGHLKNDFPFFGTPPGHWDDLQPRDWWR